MLEEAIIVRIHTNGTYIHKCGKDTYILYKVPSTVLYTSIYSTSVLLCLFDIELHSLMLCSLYAYLLKVMLFCSPYLHKQVL